MTRTAMLVFLLSPAVLPVCLSAAEAGKAAIGKSLVLESRYGTAFATVYSDGRVQVTSAGGEWSGFWPETAKRYCVFPSRAANVCVQLERDDAGAFYVAGKLKTPDASVLVF
ncbi:MAG: hypothetical protein AAF714_05265 [Pseudomonadota bacterium]